MKLVHSFKDLQNERCDINVDNQGNFYIGRYSSKRMSLNIEKLEIMLALCKKHIEDKKMEKSEKMVF